MKAEKVSIDTLHAILWHYHQNGIIYVDMEITEGGKVINIWPSDMKEDKEETKIEDIV